MQEDLVNDDELHRPPPPNYDEQVLYGQIEVSPEFQELRRRLLRFVIPTTAVFLVWYATYVVLGTFARDFMARPIAGGSINVGIVLGLAQFATTFLITGVYVWFANHRLEPLAEQIRLEWRQ